MNRDSFRKFYRQAIRVMNIFSKLDKEINTFKQLSGIDCSYGCGLCCAKKDIEASQIEFYPLVIDLYYKNQLELYSNLLNNNISDFCILYNDQSKERGLCSIYEFRGLICRLFGFSGIINKYNKPELVTCEAIKKTQEYKVYRENNLNISMPFLSDYYSRLGDIDLGDALKKYQINTAIKKAIDKLLFILTYKRRTG